MLRVAAVPPESAHDRVMEAPLVMVVGVAVKDEIAGAAGLTVMVIDFVTVPVIFVAVKIYVVVLVGETI